jgi:Domain of Unknown Function (DUF1080)
MLVRGLKYVGFLCVIAGGFAATAVRAGEEAAAANNDPDFAFQGEYSGEITTPEGNKGLGVQVIALGDGKFRGVGYIGGLPGDGWDGSPARAAEGELKDGSVTIHNDLYDAVIGKGVLTLTTVGNLKIGELKKVVRESKTQGAKAPSGAVVLFDGSTPDAFDKGKLSPEGWLIQGVTSKQKFQDFTLHVEFLLPFMPKARGQGRGNSGCYMQGRYEVQVLDSFGLKGENNECGGIYTIKAPDVNMCYPPLVWQTYDIDFTAAKYDGDKKTQDAVMTVRHNDVVIQRDVKLPKSTTAAPVKEGAEPGPLYIQDHGNQVRYRNIWLVEKK